MKKRLRIEHAEAYEPIFGTRLTIAWGDNKALPEFARQHYGSWQHCNAAPDAYGITLHCDGQMHSPILFISNRTMGESTLASTIAHEALHVAGDVLRHVGVPHTEATEEIYAYFVSWVVQQAVLAMKKRKAKRK